MKVKRTNPLFFYLVYCFSPSFLKRNSVTCKWTRWKSREEEEGGTCWESKMVGYRKIQPNNCITFERRYRLFLNWQVKGFSPFIPPSFSLSSLDIEQQQRAPLGSSHFGVFILDNFSMSENRATMKNSSDFKWRWWRSTMRATLLMIRFPSLYFTFWGLAGLPILVASSGWTTLRSPFLNLQWSRIRSIESVNEEKEEGASPFFCSFQKASRKGSPFFW